MMSEFIFLQARQELVELGVRIPPLGAQICGLEFFQHPKPLDLVTWTPAQEVISRELLPKRDKTGL